MRLLCVWFFFCRLAITAGCVVRTATARNSGSSTSLQKNTKTEFSTLRMIRTAGSIDFPQALSKFVRGEIMSHRTLHVWGYWMFPAALSDGWPCVSGRFLKGTCTEDDLCKLAHGDQELKEWMERREFLLMKLAKARKDHLIAPNDNDFGKYSFLLKDII